MISRVVDYIKNKKRGRSFGMDMHQIKRIIFMNKQKLLKPVNVVMAIDFVCLSGTAMLDDAIPKDIYGIIHPIFGYIFVLCVVFHVFLNWAWVKSNFIITKK